MTPSVGVKGGADFVDVGTVGANGLMELVAGDAEFLGPVGDIGAHLGVDFLGVVRSLGGVVFADGVGLVSLGSVVVLGHMGASSFPFLWLDEEGMLEDVPEAKVGGVESLGAVLAGMMSLWCQKEMEGSHAPAGSL
jgi:hypothetical protein